MVLKWAWNPDWTEFKKKERKKNAAIISHLICLIWYWSTQRTHQGSLTVPVGHMTSHISFYMPTACSSDSTCSDRVARSRHRQNTRTQTEQRLWTVSESSRPCSLRSTLTFLRRTSSTATQCFPPSTLHPPPISTPAAPCSHPDCLQRVQSYPLAGVLALLTGNPCAVGPADLRRRCWCESAEQRHWACVKMEGEKKTCKLMTVYVICLFTSIFLDKIWHF